MRKISRKFRRINLAVVFATMAAIVVLTGVSPIVKGENAVNSPQADGDLDAAFNAQVVGSVVQSLAVQRDGKIIIFGQFASVQGATRNRIARLNADGSLDATFDNGAGVNGVPFAVVIQPDGKILIGGGFTGVNGTARNNVARLNSDGSVDTSFNPGNGTSGGIANYVETIAVLPDGKILIGGEFAAFDNTPRMEIARLNSNGSLDAGFVPAVLSQGGVFKIVVQPDGKIIIGGGFFRIDGINQGRLARLNANGGNDPTFLIGDGVNDLISFNGIAQQTDGKILIGGAFTNVNGTARNRIARLNANGTIDATFNPGAGANNSVRQIGLQPDGKILIGGDYTSYNGTARNSLARLETSGALDTSFNVGTGFDGSVQSFVLQPDGKLVAGGFFSTYNGATRPRLARISAATAANRRPQFNFDGDGRADISVYRPSSGVWYFLNSNNGFTQTQFGVATDKPVPADYDGDGRTDLAVYRPSTGVWYLLKSAGGFTVQQFGGASGDVAVPADFDGDGRSDLVIYRPGNGTWYVLNLANNNFTVQQFGTLEDKPVPADFDGDGRSDFAVYRPSNGIWYLLRSRDGFTGQQFGTMEDRPVVGDYDGDGRADFAVFRPSNGFWYLLRSTTGFRAFPFGEQAGDQPAPADYDGDGKTDNAIYRPSTGVWFVQSSITNITTGVQFGASEDKPLPNSFVP